MTANRDKSYKASLNACKYIILIISKATMPWLKGMLCFCLPQVFLFSAFYNIEDVYKAPYPTAKHPGELPSMLHFNASKMQAQAALLPRHLAYDKQIEVERVAVKTSKCKRLRVAQRPALVPFEMLHLTTRLGPWVFLGRCGSLYDILPWITTQQGRQVFSWLIGDFCTILHLCYADQQACHALTLILSRCE